MLGFINYQGYIIALQMMKYIPKVTHPPFIRFGIWSRYCYMLQCTICIHGSYSRKIQMTKQL